MRGQKDEFCKNTVIQRAAFPETAVFKTSGCGHGLFTLEDLAKGALIAEYRGEVITQAECLRRMAGYTLSEAFYFAHLDSGLVLDAAEYGSCARFANHSCEPNCTLQKWITNGEPRVCLVALKDIQSGSELTYNYQYYQDGLDDVVSRFKRQRCACGSVVCCGTIGGRVTARHPLEHRDKWSGKVKTILDQHECAGGGGGGKKSMLTMDIMEELLRQADTEDDLATQGGISSTLPPYSKTTEYVRLAALSESMQAWQRRIELLLSSPVPVEVATFEELLQSQPVKFKMTSPLYAKIDACRRGIKAVQGLRKCLPVEPLTDTKLPPAATTVPLPWPTFVTLVQSLAEAAPIIFREEAMVAIRAYQQYSSWCEVWFHKLGGRRDAYSLDSLETDLPTLWYTLKQLAERHEEKVSPFAFLVELCLEQRIGAYMERHRIRTAKNLLQSSDEHCCQSERPQADMCKEVVSLEKSPAVNCVVDASRKDARSKKSATNAHGDLDVHCFCGFPEDISEIPSFLQCDACKRWFHMECANLPTQCVAAYKKHSVVKQAFVCPLCQYEGNPAPCPSSFLCTQSYEWHRNSNASLQYSQMCKALTKAESLTLTKVWCYCDGKCLCTFYFSYNMPLSSLADTGEKFG